MKLSYLGTALSGLALTSAAAAIDIQVTFDAQASEVYIDNGDDKTLELIPIFEAAAAHWEEIFLDVYLVQIDYWWADVSSPVANNIVDNNAGLITGDIRIPTSISYWFDPTPFADSEFPMQPYLFRDTPVSEQNEAFRNPGTVPDVFEVSYVGEAFLNDLLTIVAHEIGHVIGINNGAGSPECDDSYYDIDPGFVNGINVGLRVFGTDCAHLALGGVAACLNCQALMWTSQNDNSRTRPGAADILAIATAGGWTNIRLPRAFYLEVVGDYTEDAKWLGGLRPDMNTDAYVVSIPPSALVVNTAHVAARNLTITDDNDIFMGGFRLSVTDTLLMDGPGATINLNDPLSELEVNTLDIDNGTLVINAGLVDSEEVDVASSGIIFGAGIIDVGTHYENRGILQGNGGTLFLTTANPGIVFDLDGLINDTDAQVICTTGSVGVIGDFVGPYNGTLTVGDGQVFAFTDDLTFQGPVNLFGGATNATVNGPCSIGFGGIVIVDQVGRFIGNTDFTFSADVFVPQADDILVLEGLTTYGGGEYLGAGEIHQIGDADFDNDTTIGPITVYDWDGAGDSTTNIGPGVTLTIDAERIENSVALDGFDGILNMPGSTLVVNTTLPWAFCGSALLNVLGGAESTIDGSPVDNLGFLNADGAVHFLCELDTYTGGDLHLFDGTAVVDLTAPDNDLFDGLVSGEGTLDVNAGAALYGTGTIEADVVCNGNVRAEDGLLTISGTINVPTGGFIGTQNPTAELMVTHSWTVQQGTLELIGGTVSGGSIFVAGTARGEGLAVVPLVLNRGLVAPSGQIAVDQTGILLVSTDYQQIEDAVLEIQIGGLDPGTSHDQIQVGQTNSLGGELHISLVDGFLPSPGDEFLIMAHGALVGTFDVVLGTNIGNGLSFDVQYNPFDVRLVVVGIPCLGDLLPPAGVGIEDLLLLLANWGQPNVPGDLLPPPEVGIEDLLALLANWGPCP